MEWPLYTESKSDFEAELKWRDNSNCHVAVGRRYTYITPSILRDCYNGKEGQGPVYSLLPQPHSKGEVNSTKYQTECDIFFSKKCNEKLIHLFVIEIFQRIVHM